MVYLFLADGFEEIEALTVVDILRRADIDVKTVSITNNINVTGAHKICVNADTTIYDIDDSYDMLVLPGGMPGTTNLDNCELLKNMILSAYKNNKFISAICAAPMIFGKLNLLENKKAVCYPSFEKYLLNAIVTDDKVCVSDNVITSKAAGTASDMAFELVKLLKGDKCSEKIRLSMYYD